jgi:hypothetical protein
MQSSEKKSRFGWLAEITKMKPSAATSHSAAPEDDLLSEFEDIHANDGEDDADVEEFSIHSNEDDEEFNLDEIDWKFEAALAELMVVGMDDADLIPEDGEQGIVDAETGAEVIGTEEALAAVLRQEDVSGARRLLGNARSRAARVVQQGAEGIADRLGQLSGGHKAHDEAFHDIQDFEVSAQDAQSEPEKGRLTRTLQLVQDVLGRTEQGFLLVSDDVPSDAKADAGEAVTGVEQLRAWEKQQASYKGQMDRYNILVAKYYESVNDSSQTTIKGVQKHMLAGFTPGHIAEVGVKLAGAAVDPKSLFKGDGDKINAWGDITNSTRTNVDAFSTGIQKVTKAIRDDVKGKLEILDRDLQKAMGVALRRKPKEVREAVDRASYGIKLAIDGLAGDRAQLQKAESSIIKQLKERQKIPCLPSSMQPVDFKIEDIDDIAMRAGASVHIVRQQVLMTRFALKHESELLKNIAEGNVEANYPRQGMLMLTWGGPGTGKSSLVEEISKATKLPKIKIAPLKDKGPNKSPYTPQEIVRYLKVAIRDAMSESGCFNCIVELEEADYLTDPQFSESPEAKQFFDIAGCTLESFYPDGNPKDGGILIPYYLVNIIANTNHPPTGEASLQRWKNVEMKDLDAETKAKVILTDFTKALNENKSVYSELYEKDEADIERFALQVFEKHEIGKLIIDAVGDQRQVQGMRVAKEIVEQIIPEIISLPFGNPYERSEEFHGRLQNLIATTIKSKVESEAAVAHRRQLEEARRRQDMMRMQQQPPVPLQ